MLVTARKNYSMIYAYAALCLSLNVLTHKINVDN